MNRISEQLTDTMNCRGHKKSDHRRKNTYAETEARYVLQDTRTIYYENGKGGTKAEDEFKDIRAIYSEIG